MSYGRWSSGERRKMAKRAGVADTCDPRSGVFPGYSKAATLRIRPRQQILDVWRSLLYACYADGRWLWGGETHEPDSVSDAEQLLCLFHPMNEIESFSLADPDEIRRDVLNALAPLGSLRRIPKVITEIAIEFFERHSDENGEPRFSCAGYRTRPDTPPPTPEQRATLTVVDAYARSVTLSLAVLAFVKRRAVMQIDPSGVNTLDRLRELASQRLTAAMTGLLRSFVVHSVDPDSEPGQAMLAILRRPQDTDSELVRTLNERFRRLRTQLQEDVRIGVPDEAKPNDEHLFEVGWTWGIAAEAGPVPDVDTPTASVPGCATSRPYLYFTVSALDSIEDLQSRFTGALSLLTDDQRRLADALAVRWDITRRYWSAIARFDPERWPLADLPWRTSDQEESDYFSLLVLSIVIQDFTTRSGTVPEIPEIMEIFEELAQRGRITRRMSRYDTALELYRPGLTMRLVGSGELGPELVWPATDYASLLLKRACQTIPLTDLVEVRERLISVAEATMDHLYDRRILRGRGTGLWDDVSRLRPGSDPASEATLSWHQTECVVEALVMTARAYVQDPPRSTRMAEIAMRLLNEADHLYNQELLNVDADDRSVLRERLDEIESLIARARELQGLRINTSIALAERALRMLDVLALARQDAERSR